LDDLVVGPIVIPGRELEWTAVRASGPGGQNVNKVSSKVELRFDVARTRAFGEEVRRRLMALAHSRIGEDGVLQITSQLTRDQPKNLEDARRKLAALIETALVVPRARRATRPTASSKRRRLEEKRHRAEKKHARSRTRDD
jgi:ribosome-associated protein